MDSFNNVNRDKLQSALKNAANENGLNADRLNGAINSGKMENVLKSLNAEQAAKLKQVLNDKQALNNILNSPQARRILKDLSK